MSTRTWSGTSARNSTVTSPWLTLRQVGVEAAADRDVVGGEVQLADDQDLAVGRELDRDLAVEDLLRGVDREDLRRAGDRHRRGERGREAVHARVGAERRYCATTCCLHRREPLVDRASLLGSWNAGPRSCLGSSIDGSVLKNSTPATKSLIDRPVFGSSRMPAGRLAREHARSAGRARRARGGS